VHTFAIPSTGPFVAALPPIPALSSPAYTAAFNQVRDYGDLNSVVRNPDQEEIGLFWGYDRASMGPPPVLFVRNLEEIAAQTDNMPDENARLFAMASVAMADAAIAAWDAKFAYNFWRPVAAIQEAGVGGPGDNDGNPDTVGDPTWRPLGAPGGDPGDFTDDFTPPFPAWTSGHATMGGAVFKSLELFFGTNSFDEIDGILGNDTDYALSSQEFAPDGSAGMSRTYDAFTLTQPLDVGVEALDNSPEGENAISRIYLGIHWIFDQQDGTTLGNSIANYVHANYFGAVPEPSAMALALFGLVGSGLVARRRTR
jgi:membrane-associated phospholipid phosphatase